MVSLAKRMEQIPPSGTIQMLEKAKALEAKGTHILHLDVGEPDFPTPAPIVEAAIAAMKGGKTKYTSSRGITPLRDAISEYLTERKLHYKPQSDILVTPGSKHSLFCAIEAVIDKSDEVLVITPAWTSYFGIIAAAGGKAIEVPTSSEMKLNEEALKAKITSKTKMIMINSPNNPTGGCFNTNSLKAIADLAIDHDLLVISDEVYCEIVYDGFKHVSIGSLPGMQERTLLVDGFSKTFSMTGWRLGYVAGPSAIIEAANIIQQASTTCPAEFIQHAGVAALKDKSIRVNVEKMVQEYQKRRDFVLSACRSMKGVEAPKPQGAFYLFIKYPEKLGPSDQLAQDILTEQRMSCTPGSVFGRAGETHLRLSYATSMEVLKSGMDALKGFIEKRTSQ